MMWMGKVSAWGAIPIALIFLAGAFLEGAGLIGAVYAATAIGLLAGSYRTLNKLSGGLRLLATMWGFAAGSLALPYIVAQTNQFERPHDIIVAVAILISLFGMCFTVLHKEK
jgi:hypothetical protein